MTSGSHSVPVTTRSRVVDALGELVLEAQPDGDAVTVVLAGEFDLAMADPIRKALARAMREPPARLILDLSGVTFIDSSGLHIILDAYEVCRDGGPRLTIRPGPPCVQQVFEVTNLLNYLPFETSA
ncbi:MAG: STAS domain-containing protein [Alphaproteobacteria bacterium]|nr:STAS domain-containing protein [Alphaproteobacteria bacterium]